MCQLLAIKSVGPGYLFGEPGQAQQSLYNWALGKRPTPKKNQNVNFFQIGLDPPPSPLKM